MWYCQELKIQRELTRHTAEGELYIKDEGSAS
jgi:hypothetical protein